MADTYALAIVGGGLSGLSAGLTWAQNRDTRTFPVVILEKERSDRWEGSAHCRAADRERYNAAKRERADLVVGIVEKHLVPGLSSRATVIDIATPATFARYSGSPTGSIYDMVPCLGNFANTRSAMQTPVRGLLQPKFVHGIVGVLLGGMRTREFPGP